MRYFLYARKSTDVEDKQVMSIEAQLVELRSLASASDLDIAAEFVEKRSAERRKSAKTYPTLVYTGWIYSGLALTPLKVLSQKKTS